MKTRTLPFPGQVGWRECLSKSFLSLSALIGSFSAAALTDKQPDAGSSKSVDTLEGEALTVKPSRGSTEVLNMKSFGAGRWSGGAQLLWRGGDVGDTMDIELHAAMAGDYSLVTIFTTTPDYAIVQLSLDEKPLGTPIDLYHFAQISTTGLIEHSLGSITAGPHKLRIRITGANPSAEPSMYVGLDAVHLVRQTRPKGLAQATAASLKTLEGESLVVKPTRGSAGPQDMKSFGKDRWNGDSQLFWRGGDVGDTLEIELPVTTEGEYALGSIFTVAPDYAIVQLLFDGKPVGAPLDLFDMTKVSTTGVLEHELGKLSPGSHKLGIRIAGANPAAIPSKYVGLDVVHLMRRMTAKEREKLQKYANLFFQFIQWVTLIDDRAGFIYDHRPEPRRLKIEDLEKAVKTNPRNLAGRHLLAELLLLDGQEKKGKKVLQEVEQLYRKRLAADPQDTQSLTWLAMHLRGKEEGGRFAEQVVRLAPRAWQSWLALSSHQFQKVLLNMMAGLEGLPESGVDISRLDEGLKLQAYSAENSKAIFALAAEGLAQMQKAMDLAPVGETEPILRRLALQLSLMPALRQLHQLRGDPLQPESELLEQTRELLVTGVRLCQDQPEALGALGLFQFLNLHASLPKQASGKPEPELLEKRQAEVLSPVMIRLRELCDHASPAIAAAACEAYSALVYMIPIFGGHPPSTSDLPMLLKKAVRLEPRRCLAWDLLIGMPLADSTLSWESQSAAAHLVAIERHRALPTSGSLALLAITSSVPEEAVVQWRAALAAEPGNIIYRLQLTAAILRGSQKPEDLAAALVELKAATELGYQETFWEKFPLMDTHRLRLFALYQGLKGDLTGMRETMTHLTTQYPEDNIARELLFTLDQFK